MLDGGQYWTRHGGHSTEEGNRITRFIVRAAGLERHDRGVLAMKVAGQSREVSVERYEHFGEWAYRLRLAPARKRRRTHNLPA
jgi:hypothetical protein